MGYRGDVLHKSGRDVSITWDWRNNEEKSYRLTKMSTELIGTYIALVGLIAMVTRSIVGLNAKVERIETVLSNTAHSVAQMSTFGAQIVKIETVLENAESERKKHSLQWHDERRDIYRRFEEIEKANTNQEMMLAKILMSLEKNKE